MTPDTQHPSITQAGYAMSWMIMDFDPESEPVHRSFTAYWAARCAGYSRRHDVTRMLMETIT